MADGVVCSVNLSTREPPVPPPCYYSLSLSRARTHLSTELLEEEQRPAPRIRGTCELHDDGGAYRDDRRQDEGVEEEQQRERIAVVVAAACAPPASSVPVAVAAGDAVAAAAAAAGAHVDVMMGCHGWFFFGG